MSLTRQSSGRYGSGMRRQHLVEFAVAKEGELGENVEPEVEEAVEHDDPAVQCGEAELQHALDHVWPIELPQRHQAVGNGGLQVLLRDDQHHSRQRHQPQRVPAAKRRFVMLSDAATILTMLRGQKQHLHTEIVFVMCWIRVRVDLTGKCVLHKK